MLETDDQLECAECGAPAIVAWTFDLTGVDFGPGYRRSIFHHARVECLAGCWYVMIDEDATVQEP